MPTSRSWLTEMATARQVTQFVSLSLHMLKSAQFAPVQPPWLHEPCHAAVAAMILLCYANVLS